MSKYWAFFDTETGGLDPAKVDVLTFYMCLVDVDTKKIVAEIDLKLKPDGGRLPIVEQQALDANKIDLKAHLASSDTITYSEAKAKIIAMIKPFHRKFGRYHNLRPAGQNVIFDINFTQKHLMTKEEWDSFFHYAIIDTKLITDFLKDCGWFPPDLGTLATVVKYLQLPERDAHNAKEDTLMCLDVYLKMLEIMNTKKDGGTTQDLISLLEAE